MLETVSIIIAGLSLAVSGVTAWLTLMRRGSVKMTQPTTIYFGPDGSKDPEGAGPSPKVFLRTLMYSSAKRGQIVESMYVKLKRGESAQAFNIWVYGNDFLSRGSGLYVGPEGTTFNHHFLLPADGTKFEFLSGDYKVEVYICLVGSRSPSLVCRLQLTLTEQQAEALKDEETGVYFDWGPDSGRYHAHVRKHKDRPDELIYNILSKRLDNHAQNEERDDGQKPKKSQ